jgi:hypothetical protein
MVQNSNPIGNPVVSGLVNATQTPSDVVVVTTGVAANEEFDRFEALAANLVGIPRADVNQ